jgi:hypothetical protein
MVTVRFNNTRSESACFQNAEDHSVLALSETEIEYQGILGSWSPDLVVDLRDTTDVRSILPRIGSPFTRLYEPSRKPAARISLDKIDQLSGHCLRHQNIWDWLGYGRSSARRETGNSCTHDVELPYCENSRLRVELTSKSAFTHGYCSSPLVTTR